MKAWMPTRLKTRLSRRDNSRTTTGQLYENHALDYLKARGLRLVERNYHCRLGEIDLIMLDADMLVFIEVKYRRRSDYGDSVEQVTSRKRQKLRNSARLYLSSHPRYTNAPCRFDVVAISPGAGAAEVNWISNAIETT